MRVCGRLKSQPPIREVSHDGPMNCPSYFSRNYYCQISFTLAASDQGQTQIQNCKLQRTAKSDCVWSKEVRKV